MGAFIADRQLMIALSHDPVLGHITTFGGHPVCCAAGLAALEVLLEKNIVKNVARKARLFAKLLKHPAIKQVRTAGLLIAVQFENAEVNKKLINACIANGVLTDWFLFAPDCLRIAPPLTISEREIRQACGVILGNMGSR